MKGDRAIRSHAKKNIKLPQFILGTLIGTPLEYFFLQPWLVGSLFKKKANQCTKISEVVKLSFETFRNFPFNAKRAPYPLSYVGWATQPNQIIEELINLLHVVQTHQPKLLLEIGTATGGSFFAFTKIASSNAKIISVDLPFSNSSAGYPAWKAPFYKSFKNFQQKIFLIRSDSHSLFTLNAVKKIIGNEKIDFLFIDGDHSYEGVKRDFEMYREIVGKGGIIAFHDICLHKPQSNCKVKNLWLEIRKKYPYREFVNDYDQKWAGIGIIYI